MPRILADLAGTNQTTFRIGQGPARVTVDASACTVPRTLLAPDADGTIATQAYAAAQAAAAQAYAIQRANHTGTQLAATISDFAAAALAATAAAYDVAGAAAAAQAYAIQRANHTGTQAAATISDFAAAALAATVSAYQPLNVNLTALASDYDGATKTLTHNVSKAATSAGLALQANNGTLVVTLGPGGGAGAAFADGVTCASLTATGANGVATVQAATQDGVRLLGRAGGVSSYVGTLTVAALGASRTYTLPDASLTFAGQNIDNAFSLAQTFAGSVPGTPSSGQVMIGGGSIKAGGAISGASLTATGGVSAAATIYKSATFGLAVQLATGSSYDGGFLKPDASAFLWYIPTGTGNVVFPSGSIVVGTTALAGSERARFTGGTMGTPGATDVFVAAGAISCGAGGTFGGSVTVPNGTASAPGLRITGEATGFYRVSATAFGLAIGGVNSNRFFYDATNGAELQINQGSNLSGGIYAGASTGFLYLSGSTGPSGGGQIRVYGNTHATKSNYVELCRGATVSAYFDGSGNLTCNGAVTVAGAITHSGVNTASGSTAGRLAYFGGTSGDGAAFELRGSTYSGSPDTGFLRVGSTYVANWSTAGITLSTGALTVPNGTATAPGIRTTTYAHGLHSISSTSVGIDVAGSLVLTVGSTASSFASGTTVQFANTTSAGNGVGSIVCSGGASFAKAVFAANDASGVHYYANAGLTMRDLGTGTSTYLDLAFGSATHGAYSIRSSNAATVRLNIDTSGNVAVGGTAGNYINIANGTGELRVNGTKVVSSRKTGWAAQTASASRTDLGASPTVGAIASFLRALYDDLAAHGLIGA